MQFKVEELPYPTDALEPYLSKRTLEFHYNKHYKTYVKNLNQLTSQLNYKDLTLVDIMSDSYKKNDEIFQNAAQAFNHAFYFNSLTPNNTPASPLLIQTIENRYVTLREFKEAFAAAASKLFGSGWIWLVQKPSGELSIETTKNADNPILRGITPLLVCDLWEHAYYLDYQNEKTNYINQFWKVANWEFAEKNLNTLQYSVKNRDLHHISKYYGPKSEMSQ